jgi:hypothetical protein
MAWRTHSNFNDGCIRQPPGTLSRFTGALHDADHHSQSRTSRQPFPDITEGFVVRGHIVFSVVLGRTVTPDVWARFLERIQAAGLTPLTAFQRFITRVADGEQQP